MAVPTRWVVAWLLALSACSGARPRPPATVRVEPAGSQERERETCPEGMASIASGTFMMGSTDGASDERPVHQMSVEAFCLDVTEVPVSAYARCVAAGACAKPTLRDSNLCNTTESNRRSHPQNCVSWHDASAYCGWIGGRLPTEAEWEYAARGGAEGRKWPWGDSPATPENACMRDPKADRPRSTCPVGSFPSGAFGLKDMAGNVWEWVADRYAFYAGRPSEEYDSRVVRGGSWSFWLPLGLTGANRHAYSADAVRDSIGFRCASGPSPASSGGTHLPEAAQPPDRTGKVSTCVEWGGSDETDRHPGYGNLHYRVLLLKPPDPPTVVAEGTTDPNGCMEVRGLPIEHYGLEIDGPDGTFRARSLLLDDDDDDPLRQINYSRAP